MQENEHFKELQMKKYIMLLLTARVFMLFLTPARRYSAGYIANNMNKYKEVKGRFYEIALFGRLKSKR